MDMPHIEPTRTNINQPCCRKLWVLVDRIAQLEYQAYLRLLYVEILVDASFRWVLYSTC